jgi:hypothetical protein
MPPLKALDCLHRSGSTGPPPPAKEMLGEMEATPAKGERDAGDAVIGLLG